MDDDRWRVYLIRCKDDSLYCGVTVNMHKRLLSHVRGGAKYTRGRGPFVLTMLTKAMSQSEAQRLEAAIKKLTREKKIEALQAYAEDPSMWSLETLDRLNAEAEEDSRRRSKLPYVFKRREELDDMPPFPFPVIGYREADGWVFDGQDWFVDGTGCDMGGGLALTVDGLKRALREFLANIPATELKTFGFGIVEQGQFQLKVGLFRRRQARQEVAPSA